MLDSIEPSPRQDLDLKQISELNYMGDAPDTSALIKKEFVDFRVDEELGFPLSHDGEHLYLRIRKTGLSTVEVARRLAGVSEASLSDIGYSGMKDKRGECTQWFSIPLSRTAEERLREIENGFIEILDAERNSRKLRIGSHKKNRFEILLRQCQGRKFVFEERLDLIKASGVPNYFGSQRFGKDMSNLTQVMQLFRSEIEISASDRINVKARKKRSMLFSAARGYLFNQVLSERIQQKNWNQFVPGDVLNLAGTNRYFLVDNGCWDDKLQRRLDSFDIHISGPLAGVQDPREKYISNDMAARLEEAVLVKFQNLLCGLISFGLKTNRRPLRFVPENLKWNWLTPEELKLQFTLPRGAYATSLLRELCKISSFGNTGIEL